MEYALNICFHMEYRFIIILIISVILLRQDVQDRKCYGRAEKASTKLWIIGQMALNPGTGAHNIT